MAVMNVRLYLLVIEFNRKMLTYLDIIKESFELSHPLHKYTKMRIPGKKYRACTVPMNRIATIPFTQYRYLECLSSGVPRCRPFQ